MAELQTLFHKPEEETLQQNGSCEVKKSEAEELISLPK